MAIDTTNKFIVAVSAGGILMMNPPRGPMKADDALLLAAWLVSMAEHEASAEFSDVLAAVQDS